VWKLAGVIRTDGLALADLVLTPAACYPVYPLAAKQGCVPRQGYVFDVASDCIRREPSRDIDRLQSFRMRKYVRIGPPEKIKEFREGWIDEAKGITSRLGLRFRSGERLAESGARAARLLAHPGAPVHSSSG
jgi:seryl-tRNA synthetase